MKISKNCEKIDFLFLIQNPSPGSPGPLGPFLGALGPPRGPGGVKNPILLKIEFLKNWVKNRAAALAEGLLNRAANHIVPISWGSKAANQIIFGGLRGLLLCTESKFRAKINQTPPPGGP